MATGCRAPTFQGTENRRLGKGGSVDNCRPFGGKATGRDAGSACLPRPLRIRIQPLSEDLAVEVGADSASSMIGKADRRQESR